MRVAYNNEEDVSLVRCTPKTGRTHQIRIHLRELGHPISNDPVYADGANPVSVKLPELLLVSDLGEDVIREGKEVLMFMSELSGPVRVTFTRLSPSPETVLLPIILMNVPRESIELSDLSRSSA